MWLSANLIVQLVQAKTLVIDPFDKRLLKPASYVLRLGSDCLVWRNLSREILLNGYKADKEHFERLSSHEVSLPPGGVVLASSLEVLSLPENVIGILSTLSHIAR